MLLNGTSSRAETTGLGGVTAPGAITLATICNRSSVSGFRNAITLLNGSSLTQLDLSSNATTLIMEAGGSVSNGPTIATGWQYNAGDKATGTAVPRFHKQAYGTDAVVAHSNGSASITSGGTPTKIGVGTFDNNSDWFAGDILVVGIWNRQLADWEHEWLATDLAAWLLLNPDWLVIEDASGALPANIPDLSGKGAPLTTLTSLAVTTSSSPVGYGVPGLLATFDLASGAATVTAVPAVAAGSAPAASVSAGGTVAAAIATSAGSAPVAVVSAGSTTTAVVADATGAAPAAGVTASAGTDTFESRSNGTLGAPWVTFGGQALPTVSSGEAFANADLTLDAAANPVAIGPDMQAELTLAAAPTVNTNMGFEVHARISNGGTDFYTFRWDNVGGNRARLISTVAGTPTVIASVSSPATLNTVTGLRIVAVGTSIKGYLKVSGAWTEVASATSSTITAAGYPGFGTQLASGGANPIGVEDVTWGLAGAASATVTAVPALALGSAAVPAVSAGSAVTAVTALALGSAPVGSVAVTANANVTAVVALALGSAPVAVVSGSGSATVAAVPATAAGSAPPANSILSSVVGAPAVIALGSAPIAVISSAGNATVTAVPAVGLGSAPAGVLSGAQTWVAVIADGAASAPAAVISAGATVIAVPALALGSAPRPTVSPAPASGGVSGDAAATFAEASS